MSEEELKDYLKNNLKIITETYSVYGKNYVDILVTLNNEIITQKRIQTN